MVPAPACAHPNATTKRYVGSAETYQFCPACFETWGGEETAAKRELLASAAAAEEALVADELEATRG